MYVGLNELRITKIESVITVRNEKGVSRNMVDRFAFALSFARGGKLVYVHRGVKFYSTRDCAVIIPKGKSYALKCLESGDFPLINFQAEGFNPSTFTVVPLSNASPYLLEFDRLESVWNGGVRNDLACLGATYDLLARLINEGRDAGKRAVVRPALDYIDQNFCSADFSVAECARRCFTSEAYFRRVFIEEIGTPPAKYVKGLRLAKAKELLVASDESVTHIAEECGFGSVYYFCQAFKSATGLTPSAYRLSSSRAGY